MRHVTKTAPPPEFETWKASATEAWVPSYANLRNPEKQGLHLGLLAEQGYVCCYCGRRVGMSDSHIEHFRPQELHKDLALDYQNLLASCIRETKPGSPLHCGHAKGHSFDEAKHISPQDIDCEERFSFTYDGQVQETEAGDEAAKHMLKLLQLDLLFLRGRRAEAIQSVFDAEFLDSANDAELRQLAEAFRARDERGFFQPFGHVVARFAEQRLVDITV